MASPSLTDDEKEMLAERAAIRQFDGKMTREEADRLTWEEYKNGTLKTIPK